MNLTIHKESEISCGKERSTRAGEQIELRRQLKCLY